MKMKTYSESTLKNFSKEQLIEQIRCLEENYASLDGQLNRVLDINTKLVNLLNKNKIEWFEWKGTKAEIKDA